MAETRAILVMAYGTPRGLDDVEAYYTHIRRGRPPPPELLEELTDRYRAIGGRSPLFEITQAQADGVARRLEVPAYLGQKHQTPYISDAVARMASDGIERAVGLVLAPHYSAMSIGQYAAAAERAAEVSGWTGKLEMIESWNVEPGYIEWLSTRVEDALAELPEHLRAGTTVIFSAHSLPARVVDQGDPYEDQLRATGEAVATRAGLTSWRIGWQSAGRTADRWLGPDILDILDALAEESTKAVVVCSCGFVADHLEVLYDVDIEAKARADDLGIALVRTRSPNDDPEFLDMLAELVGRAMRGAG